MNLKTTLFLALAGVVAAAALLISEKPWKKGETAVEKPETAEKALFEKPPESVDRVEVVLKDGQRVFKKDGEDWQILEPLEAPANNYEVKSLVEAVTGLKYVRSYGKDDRDRPSSSITGLDKPTVVRLYQDDKLQAALEVGASLPTGTGNYVRLAGAGEIRESKTAMNPILNKRMDAYRDQRVIKFEAKDAQRIKIEGTQACVLVRSGENWLMESPVRARVDKTKVDALLHQMGNLYANEWEKDAPVSYGIYQLDAPRLKITVDTDRSVPARFKPGDAAATRPADTQPSTQMDTYTLMLGGTTGSTPPVYFCRLGSRPWVFTLAEVKVKPFQVPVGEFQDKTLAKLEPTKIKQIDVQAGGETMTLAKGADNKWKLGDGAVADAGAVDSLIKAVMDMKAVSFADTSAQVVGQDWGKPRAKVAFTQEGQLEPVTLLVGTATPSGRMVYVRNAAEEPVAAVNGDAVEPLLLPPVSYRDRLVLSVPRDRVSKIQIDRPGSTAIKLAKNGAKWLMETPAQAPADGESVRNLVSDLSNLQAKRVVSTNDKAKFGLDKPEVTLTVWVDRLTDLPNAKVVGATQPAASQPAGSQPVASQPAPPEIRRLFLGRKDGKVYAALEGAETTWELDARVYDDAAAEMHDRLIASFEVVNVADVSFESSPQSVLTFRKAGEEWRYVQDPMLRVEAQKVIDVLNSLHELKTHRYVDYAAGDLAKYGLGDDGQRVVINLTDGRRTEIRLSKAGPEGDLDKSRYAVLAGTNKVFLLKEDQAKRFDQKLADFEKSDKAPAAPPGPAPFEPPPDESGM